MHNTFEKTFDLRYFEMNKSGEASPLTMLTLLQETASEHCHSIGRDLFSLMSENLGWVLLSGFMQMERYPRYRERITIRTWISKYMSIRGFRENIIYDEENNIIGRAKGLWVFYDIEKRRPTKIHPDFKEKWSSLEDVCIEHDISAKLEVVKDAESMKEFTVNMYDMDSNKHVNNIRYLQWLLESMPDEVLENYYLYTIDGRFITEAHYEDKIVSLTKSTEEDHTFIHTIHIKGTDKVCATGKTVWKKIES